MDSCIALCFVSLHGKDGLRVLLQLFVQKVLWQERSGSVVYEQP